MVLPMNEALASAPSRGPAEHDVRDQIVEAADKHFSRYGYEKTTVSDLANAIGYSKAYIYKFFDSKQAIGEVICTNCVQGIMAAIDQSIAAGETSSESLRAMFRTLVEATATLFTEERKLYDITGVA